MAERLGYWVFCRLSRLPRSQRTKMWGMYIAGEFGGMNEVMARLHRLTGENAFLETARYFDNDKLFFPLLQGADALGGLHANQHIPQAVGAMKLYEQTGESSYYEIAKRFWQYVTDAHCYCIGGTGEAEMFHAPYEIGKRLTDHTAESCASYNMLKLTESLFCYEPDARLMNYYQNTMLNHIVASNAKEAIGASTYFMPLSPGAKKEFDVENSCCHGTGLENHFKYAKNVFYRANNRLYVNLLVPSVLKFDKSQVVWEQLSDDGHWRLRGSGFVGGNIAVIKPDWAENVKIVEDDSHEIVPEMEDGYLILEPKGNSSWCFDLFFSYKLRLSEAPDDPEMVSLSYGPYVLAAITLEKEMLTVCRNENYLLEKQFVPGEGPNTFIQKENGILWKPLSDISDETYQVYIKCFS